MTVETKTKERPILFSGEMVRAILSGAKTQTRRVMKPQPYEGANLLGPEYYEAMVVDRYGEEQPGPTIFGIYDDMGEWGIKCPYEVGMKLWVRETWCKYGKRNVIYRANYGELTPISDGIGGPWRPSIFMPRWACRITLELTGVRAERIQSISAKDIIAEGAVARPHNVDGLGKCPVSAFDGACYPDLKSLWASGWDSINGKRKGCDWKSNPWVWAITFKRSDQP